jgi:ArsR family transcriptional regulator
MTYSNNTATEITNAAPGKYDDASPDALALSQVCKAASDPLRLDILRVLQSESFGVLELCHIFELAQPKLSHHLKVLANAGLVNTRRDGNSIFYRRPLLNMENTLALFIQHLFYSIDTLPLGASAESRIESIKNTRALSSLDFFEKNADRFREKQALVIENSQYFDNVSELVLLANLPASATIVEIGPGEGDYLLELSKQFAQVYAIDNSRPMLELAEMNAVKSGVKNIQFIHSTAGATETQHIKADLAVCNMVLHHVPSPKTLVKNIAGMLNSSGFMLVSELCHHDQQWVQDTCGDLWLGFEPNELEHWAETAGLQKCHRLFLGQRNGFQVQIHLFKKLSN